MCPLAIRLSSLEIFYLDLLPIFQLGCLWGFLLLLSSCMKYLYILEIRLVVAKGWGREWDGRGVWGRWMQRITFRMEEQWGLNWTAQGALPNLLGSNMMEDCMRRGMYTLYIYD